MKDDTNYDMDRYFNDPEYRRHVLEKRRENDNNNHNPIKDKGESSAPGFLERALGKQNENRKKKTAKITPPSSNPPPPPRNNNGSDITIGWGDIFKGFGVFLFIILLLGSAYMIYLFQGLPSIEELENPKTDIASHVMSRDGAVLDKYFTENRTYVNYDNISPHVVDALVSTEDHRFYTHWGVDMYRTLAIPYHVLSGNPQGGSTISQQLARNLYRKIGREVSIQRKLREMITAIQIEKNYTKKEIIEMYLNTVEYSNSAYGIETASLTHFNKPASQLSVPEAATLIGALQAVSAYNPRTRPERATLRRNTVLSRMARHNLISEEQYQTFREEPIELDYNPPFKTGRQSRYFGEYVRQQAQGWADENGYDLYTDGLTIHTTIDSRMQYHAQQAVETQLAQHQKRFEQEWTSPGGTYMDNLWEENPTFLDSFIEETDEYKNGFFGYKTRIEVLDSLKLDSAFVDSVMRARTRLEASFVAIEPSSGNVMAWIGGSDYSKIQRDNVYQSRRQTGSTFKPFVYSVAIDNGYRPYHRFSKYPLSFYDRGGTVWAPRDAVLPQGPELISLRQGLGRSLNNITIRLLPELAGAHGTNRLEDLSEAGVRIAEMAKNLGVNKSPLGTNAAIALGAAQATLLEMTSAYATFANKGVHIEPLSITRIEDKEGNVLVEYHAEMKQEAISPETAYIMIDMMRGVIRGGSGWFGTGVRLINQFNVTQDIAGKTGTTANSADNWFIGMTPNLVMGSWVGGEDRRIRFPKNLPGSIGQGARTALPIVGQFINYCTADSTLDWSYDAFEQPSGLILDPPDEEEIQRESDTGGRISW
ncbi:MAG: transglycosylase domain-containing protein [Balneolales bacterium]